jgi:Family of unknown function (DUF5808)
MRSQYRREGGNEMKLYGKVLGIPYDFRLPTWKKLKSHYWNPDDDRIFIPRAFGVGWDINFYRFKERYPALFYAVLSITILVQVMQYAVYIRMLMKKKRKDEEG